MIRRSHFQCFENFRRDRTTHSDALPALSAPRCATYNLLQERGIEVNHETARFYWHNFWLTPTVFAAVNFTAPNYYNQDGSRSHRTRCKQDNAAALADEASSTQHESLRDCEH